MEVLKYRILIRNKSSLAGAIPYTLYLIPYTLYLIPYTLYLIPYCCVADCLLLILKLESGIAVTYGIEARGYGRQSEVWQSNIFKNKEHPQLYAMSALKLSNLSVPLRFKKLP
ncbi:hypothetical protein [Pontibacter sp. HSC-36F09]|uniref:hypothetical protein n=1 Tax=Pontibacter sp. HSC-36F09 TaxID=2910966 RepID=UPI00209F6257|nr:hypothetical protein [Pontibacter sp. HSC-36F09]MCP2042527.1 hypothetical protein [Pontibacter sp. HSC-36F09]